MTKPNFLIVGAAKSGTTSLHEYLRAHPEVFMPKVKEPGFFISKPAFGFDGAIDNPDEYEALFDGVRSEKAVGEASTGYLYDKQAARKIADYLTTKVKILILLRSPIDMAYSLWGHNVRDGYEDIPFLEAIEEIEGRLTDENFLRNCRNKTWIHNYAYLDRAKYSKQVERFIDVFGRDQVKVYIFEAFFSNPRKSYQEVCRFLSISPHFLPEFRRHNVTGTVRSQFILRLCNERMAWKEPLKLITPIAFREHVKRKLNQLNREDKGPPALSSQDRKFLWNLFEEDITALESLLGIPLKKDVWQ